MRKVTCVVLFLIAFETCAIFNFAGTTELIDKRNAKNEEFQNQQPMAVELVEEEYPDEYTNQEPDNSGQPIGRWRSTGKALEPKWRDGDSVPLVPFHTVTISSKMPSRRKQNPDEVGNKKNHASGQRSSHWQSHRKEKGTVITDEYNYNTSEKPNHKNNYQGFRGRETRLSRRRKPPQLEGEEIHQIENCSNHSKELHENHSMEDSKPIVKTPKHPYNINGYLEGVALRYRETFQNYPGEYEFNDEEYQRPRTRKRRPPQNDEFVELKTSSTSSTTRSTPSTTQSTTRFQKYEYTRRNNLLRTNHNRTIKVSDRPSENSELKSLLKMQQVEGLSLSEILQRRNLTLSDLLQGKAGVINLLKSKQAEEAVEEELSSKAKAGEMKKISASSNVTVSSTSEKAPIILRKSIHRPQMIPAKFFAKKTDDPFSSIRAASSHAFQKVLPTQEVQKKVLPTQEMQQKVLPTQVQQKVHPTESINFAKFSVPPENSVITTTTENANLKEKEKVKIVYDEDEIMEFSDFTSKNSNSPKAVNSTKAVELTNIDNSSQNSESTLSIEHLLTPTMQSAFNENESEENTDESLEQSSEKNQLENKIPHSEHEDDSISKEANSFEIEYQNDDPYKKTSTESDTSNSDDKKESIEDHEVNLNHKTEDIYFEMEPDARKEILELFNSGTSATKLESLLKARNMSIEDLISLRQRGSSQLHLAEVSRNRGENNFKLPSSRDLQENHETQEIQSKDDKMMEVETPKPDCPPTHEVKEFIEWMKEKEMQKEPVKEILHIKEFETLPPIWSDQFGNPYFSAPNKEDKNIEEISLEDEKENVSKINQESDGFMNILSHFKSSQPFNDNESSEGISFYSRNVQVPSSNLPEKKNNSVIPVEDGHVQEIVSDISHTFNNIFKSNIDEGSVDEKHSISRVRISIIVSGAILGITIIVFLGIFIACRVRQKKKYTYSNTFSRAVFQSPVLTARKLSNTSSLNTIMVNVVATSTTKRPEKPGCPESNDDYDLKSDIEHDSLDANDSWETIPDFMK